MVYEQFQEAVREKLQALLGPTHTLTLRTVPKNNGVELEGISDTQAGSSMSPTVYLNSYYSLYTQGQLSIDDICREILSIFTEHPIPGSIRPEDLSDIEKMRPLIMMRLIHLRSNRTLLSDVPHLPYLDLAIVFYLSLEQDMSGQMTILIHEEYMRKWGLDLQSLLDIALENTPFFYPAEIHSMMEVLKCLSLADEENDYLENGLKSILEEEDEKLPLFVLTNSSGIYGAACMLYPGTLKNFSRLIDRDLLIIPSSVHEVLLAPYDEDMDIAALNAMVSEINRTEVPREDRLSDHVYLYRRDADDISIPLIQSQAACL